MNYTKEIVLGRVSTLRVFFVLWLLDGFIEFLRGEVCVEMDFSLTIFFQTNDEMKQFKTDKL